MEPKIICTNAIAYTGTTGQSHPKWIVKVFAETLKCHRGCTNIITFEPLEL